MFTRRPSPGAVHGMDSMIIVRLITLPPNTLKADICPVLQPATLRRCEAHICTPRRTAHDVTFGDVHGVKRTLHVYTERPLHLHAVHGQEVFVLRKRAKSEGGVEEESAATGYCVTYQFRPGAGVGPGLWVQVQVRVREYIHMWHMYLQVII